MTDALVRGLYNTLLPAAAGLARLSALFLPKMREAIDGRKGFRMRWRECASSLDAQPIWFHVSSVGEFEQARPIISAIEKCAPEIPVILTFSSPSGFEFARRREPVDGSTNIVFIDYLPADFARNMNFCLDCVNPRLLVLVKFDLWPNLIWQTKKRDIPIVLVDATLSPTSKRLTGPGRLFYRSIYRSLDKILAISDADAARFEVSVDKARIGVTGDTRFDRVMERWKQRTEIGFSVDENGVVIVAGSTWPSDERVLLKPLAQIMKSDESVYLILAPHEPLPERVEELIAWANSEQLSVSRASEQKHSRVIIIDTIGILAEAYRLGDFAYVGGSFSTGVHSVIEPAIAGLPVIFGPVHQNSFEALRLIEASAAFVVTDQTDASTHLSRLARDGNARREAGARARGYVESQLGATDKCMAVIRSYL